MNPKTSAVPGFYKLPLDERLKILKEFASLTEEEVSLFKNTGSLGLEKAEMMIENVVGTFELPFGIAANFMINGKDYFIPMVIEEPSVVAGSSNAAKLARPGGGFRTSSSQPLMVGQVQLVGVENTEKAKHAITSSLEGILQAANNPNSTIVKLGGGLKEIETKEISTPRGKMLIVNLIVDVRDAMGANAVNTMAEKIAPLLESLSGGEARLRIISNLADKRIAKAEAVWKKQALEDSMKVMNIKGEDIVDYIVDAYEFACEDQHRATTNNKGIMNGIDAVCIATGNDFRALEAGVHSFASMGGYKPLAKFEKTSEGDLAGSIELPIAVGIVGGSTKTNLLAKTSLKILNVGTSQELAEIIAAVGLAQNFAALRALATEGINRGHMRLHAKNLTVSAGAKEDEIDDVVNKMIEEKNVSENNARKILEDIRK
jgi:hydroxymethylglutaryl-CoA reductase